MKRILLLISIVIGLNSGSYAQDFKIDRFEVEGVDTIKYYLLDTIVESTLTKEQLYSNSLKLISASFKDSRSVIESKDLDLGEIVYKGYIADKFIHRIVGEVDKKGRKKNDEFLEDESRLYFKCHLFLKDKKFKIVLTDLEMPITAMMPDLKIHVTPVDSFKEFDLHSKVHQMAINYIKSLPSEINKKPMNDF